MTKPYQISQMTNQEPVRRVQNEIQGMMQKGIILPQPQISKPPDGYGQRAKIGKTAALSPNIKECNPLYIREKIKIVKEEGKYQSLSIDEIG
jgi:hypothetical protein